MDRASDVLADIFAFKDRATMDFPHEGNLNDVLSFGFSYVEHEDYMVAYVAARPDLMKQIFAQVPDSEIDMYEGYIGKLWTANLIVSDRVKKDHVMFSNADITVALDLNVNPNKIGDNNADL